MGALYEFTYRTIKVLGKVVRVFHRFLQHCEHGIEFALATVRIGVAQSIEPHLKSFVPSNWRKESIIERVIVPVEPVSVLTGESSNPSFRIPLLSIPKQSSMSVNRASNPGIPEAVSDSSH